MNESRYNPGDQIVLRRILNGEIYRVTAATVVKDSPELVALYWGPGYPLKSRRNLLSVTSNIQSSLKDSVWRGSRVIMLASPAAAHAIYAWWGAEDHKFLSWYINLQAPLCRTAVGFDTTDYLLDIVASPDRSEWSWKDEDEFEEAVAAGNISAEQAVAIRSEGVKAVQLLQEGPASCYEAWMNWAPPREWEIPEMPLNWDI
jgi:hypothetical protein